LIPGSIVADTPPVPRLLLPLALLALLAPACGKEIGDSCATNVDCQEDGTRYCDLSQPGGYCTINGCDEKSCPSKAVCIRIFPYESPGATCAQDSDCGSSELCLPDGFCVPRLSERRYCERKCGSNGDCRGGYVCREAGIEGVSSIQSTYGSIALVANANLGTDASQSIVVKFCAPNPTP
jgi:hypothetical protein